MFSIRTDDYTLKTENTQAVNQSEKVKGKQAALSLANTEATAPSDAVEINNPAGEVDPNEVEESQLRQTNKALDMRENVELEKYKDSLKAAVLAKNSFAKIDALNEIAKIENKRLTWDRCSEGTQNLCVIISRSLMGADVSEELEDLSAKDRKIYHDVKKELSKVSTQNRGKIPQKLVIFYIKKAQGDYSGYTPKESQNLVEARMYTESVANAPLVALELEDPLQSEERAAAANRHHIGDEARQRAIDLTGFDPETGKETY